MNHLNFQHTSKTFRIGILVNLLYVFIELSFGFFSNSLALIADAGHNLADVSSLILSLLGFRFIKTKVTRNNTFGLRKFSILFSLINSMLLVLSGIWILYESFERFLHPKTIDSFSIIIVASIGVIINFFTAYLFFQDRNKELNIKGAFLHMLADGLVSLGVIISGILLYFTNWVWLDSFVSFAIGGLIIYTAWDVLIESWKLSLAGIPKEISLEEVKKVFIKPQIVAYHDLHVWAISTMENAAIIHIILNPQITISEMQELKKQLKYELKQLGITHSTIEFDFSS
ncbi:MAG: cation diffusion facilitator family transporter [Leptospiraceae bacterium]|nr:cation diffusion facilitator family transporter [Leptospiraceae bacterium]